MDFSVFRDNLKNLISNRGLSNKEFADEIQTTPATISRYLNGNRTPDIELIVRIAVYFDISIDWLLGVKECDNRNITKDIKQIIDKYSMASVDDRRVVHAVLQKYGDD